MIDESAQGRLFLHYGNVMIGVALTSPATLRDAKQRGVKEFTIPADGGLDAGYAVETALPGDFDGNGAKEQLQAFRNAVCPLFDRMALTVPGDYPRLVYRNAAGVSMAVEWRPGGNNRNGESSVRLLDGKPIPDIDDHTKWPLLHNPFLDQACGTTAMTVQTTDNRSVTLDFSGEER